MAEHLLPDTLRKNQPVRILVVGAGGSGSAIFLALPYLNQAMRVWGYRENLEVTLMDGDTVSETNCIRQPFSFADVGLNKATVTGQSSQSLLGNELEGNPSSLLEERDRHRQLSLRPRYRMCRHPRRPERDPSIRYTSTGTGGILPGPWQQRQQRAICPRPAAERQEPAHSKALASRRGALP